MDSKASEFGSRTGVWTPILGVVLLVVVVVAVALALLGYGREALLLLATIAAISLAITAATVVSKRVVSRHLDDLNAAERDGDEAAPALLSDPDVPLGATAEVHDDLKDVDLPREHPARRN